jgi:chromosome segregation protein
MEKFIPNLSEKIKQQKSENQILLNLISKERTIISELNIEIVKTIEKRNVLQVQFNNLKSQFEFETNKKFKANNNKKISTENFEVQKSSIQTKIKLKRESIIDFNKEIVNLNNLKTDNEKKLRNLIENSTSKVNEKNQAEFIINNQKERLMSEYGITVENVINQYSLSIEKKKAQEIVAKLKNQIKEIGNINLDSIEKYKEIKERYFKIYNSEKELMEAKDIIVSAIHNMDKIIVNKLDETVKNVNNEMINIFKTMFGGGMAEVKYTDPKNILISGIEIIAQPPGKTVKNLKLFSGGEKSIIAITLLFAILKYKPIPLCILDEVEAALDEANVLRFASYLQQLKKQTQFIVVTHRIGTMSKVDHLFGATMQTRGVTSFFTVKLSDAKKMIE